MSPSGAGGRGRLSWLAYGMLFVLSMLLVVRAAGLVGAVLTPAAAPHLPTTQSGSQDPGTVVAGSDSTDGLQTGPRNPFTDPPAPARPRRVRRAPAPAPRPEVPSLRALLYDTVNPSVQLRTSREDSAWLHVGETFDGWTVAEITAASVTIVRDDQRVVLP
jgi:hypothetical protein